LKCCPVCKQPAELRINLKLFCSYDCAAQWGKTQADKAKAKRQIEQRRADREKLKRLKTRSEWQKDLQVVFNKFIRLRDAELPCISCGHPNDGSRQFHASHYKSVGGNPALRFDLANVHSACSICNNYLSGNLVPYRVALIAKVGQAEVDRLEGKQEPLKITIEQIQQLIGVYKQKCKDEQLKVDCRD
jgi:5-methylcytosine-specific restriction endonuclease McrA